MNEHSPFDFKCPKCGRVHRGISADEALRQVEQANAYLDTLTPDELQQHYGGRRASIESYQRCHSCGCPGIEFVPAQPGDSFCGQTLPAIVIAPNELLSALGGTEPGLEPIPRRRRRPDNDEDVGLRIETRLLNAFGDVNKAKDAAVKQQNGKSIVVGGGGKPKKDVWDF